MQLQYGFRTMPTDPEFALRSARYLSALGYRPAEIRTSLVDELKVAHDVADEIVAELGGTLAIAS